MSVTAISRPRLWAAADDDELVRGVREGHDEAFDEIYRRYHPPLNRFASRLLGHRHRGLDDVTQDVFHRTLLVLRQPAPASFLLRAWLYRLAHNRCIDELRRERRAAPAPDIVPAPPADPDPLWCEVAGRALLREIVAGVAALPPRQRRALVQVAMNGTAHAELARELEVSVEASKSLVRRARVELQSARCAH